MPDIKPKAKKISITKLKQLFNNKKKALIAIALLVLLAAAITGIILVKNNKQHNTAEDQPLEVNNKLAEQVIELKQTGDCQKGLDQLASFDTKKAGDLTQPIVQGRVVEVLQYRINCFSALHKYDDALKNANELLDMYNRYGGSDFQKKSLMAQIDTIKVDQETENNDKINEKSRNVKDTYNGPRL